MVLWWDSETNTIFSYAKKRCYAYSSRPSCTLRFCRFLGTLSSHSIFSRYPIYYPRTSLLALPSRSSNSDPGSHSGPSFPLRTAVRSFLFIARRTQHFLPSSTLVRLCVPTLLGAHSSYFFFFFCVLASKVKSQHGGNRTQGPTLLM